MFDKISLEQISKSYGNKTLFENLNLHFKDNSVHCFLGPSGCGKTTLLKILMGIEAPSKGRVIPDELPKKAVVFQSAQLLNWRTVEENIHLPLELQNKKLTTLSALLKTLKLENTENLFPEQLSGGMQMRVSVARALVTNPEVLFLDEPLSALDEVTRYELQEEIRTIKETQKMTVFLVTHSFSEAAFMADVVHIFKPNGEIKSIPSPLPPLRKPDLRYSQDFTSWVAQLEKELRHA